MYDEYDVTPNRRFNPPTLQEILDALPAFIIDLLQNVDGSYLAGGAIRSVYDNLPTDDYDIFFENEAAHMEAVERGRDRLRSDYQVLQSLQGCTTYCLYGRKVQFITEYGPPETIIADFDFTCNKLALAYRSPVQYPAPFNKHNPKREWVLYDKTDGAAFKRQLVNNKVRYPARHMQRIFDFRKRGYTITPAEFQRYFELCGVPKEQVEKMQLYRNWPINWNNQAYPVQEVNTF